MFLGLSKLEKPVNVPQRKDRRRLWGRKGGGHMHTGCGAPDKLFSISINKGNGT